MRRRRFIAGSLSTLATLGLSNSALSQYRFAGNAFQLGIASGDATNDSIVLWTRIAPEPMQPDGGINTNALRVKWEIATDRAMNRVIQRGEQSTDAFLAHSVHVDVQRLDAGRDYWYRFHCNGQASQIGHTRTLPAGDATDCRFVTTSCQNYTHGYFGAYNHMVQDAPDFVLHLGDYIYDTSFGETFRKHDSETAPATLTEFRTRHALYKTDIHLQHAHAELPFYIAIDNHDALEDNDPTQYAKRAAAYQAWYEHMPVRGWNRREPNRFDLQRKIQIGNLAQISLLDTRQYRDTRNMCRDNLDTAVGFGNYRERCDDLFDDARTMLGAAQEQWLYDNLQNNTSHWNVIASSGPVLPYRIPAANGDLGYIGSWDAYPANRARLSRAIASAKQGHPLILSGDVHSFWTMDGERVADAASSVPAIEFVSSSISANWPEPLAKPIRDNMQHNPQVTFYEGQERGYLLHDVNAREWRTRFRAVGNARLVNMPVKDLVTYRVKNGINSVEAI